MPPADPDGTYQPPGRERRRPVHRYSRGLDVGLEAGSAGVPLAAKRWSVAFPTEGDNGSRHPLHSPHRPSFAVLARARKEYSRASVALAETRAARSPQAHRRQEVTFSASKEKRAGGPPVAAARGFRRLNDGSPRIGAIALPSKTEPGVSVPDRPQVREHCPGGRPDPFLRTPRSLAACGGGLGNGPTCFGKPDI
jgi:hypothetical protein